MAEFLTGADDRPREVKALIYGASGAGKTTLGVTAPDPVILLAERQGFESVRDAARRLGKPLPPTFLLSNVEELKRAIVALRQPEPLKALALALAPDEAAAKKMVKAMPYKTPQTVVFDSMTEMLQMVDDEVSGQANRTIGRDGLPSKPRAYWGVLKERGQRFIRAARDLPYHVLMLALLDDRIVGDDDNAERIFAPLTPMRSFPPMLAAACNIVGHQSMRMKKTSKDKDAELVHRVRFAGPDWMMTKPMRPLADEEGPDVTAWIKKLQGEVSAEPLDLGEE